MINDERKGILAIAALDIWLHYGYTECFALKVGAIIVICAHIVINQNANETCSGPLSHV